jgi:hypothetical protein
VVQVQEILVVVEAHDGACPVSRRNQDLENNASVRSWKYRSKFAVPSRLKFGRHFGALC